MTLSRRVRAASRFLLSPSGRSRLRRFYQARASPRAALSISVVPDGANVHVGIESGSGFRIATETWAEFRTHFEDLEYAAEVAAFLRESISPGILFDVGARHALFSLLYCQLHASNRAFAYEPSPLFARQSLSAARLNGLVDRLEVVRKAIAETEGQCPLLFDRDTGCVQVMQFQGTIRGSWVEHVVEATTLDAEAVRVGNPSLVKIDVEGYELEVLQGAARVLGELRPTILLELHLNFLEERGIAPSRVIGLLTDSGYRLHDLRGRRLSGSSVNRSWANVMHLVALSA